MKKIFLLIVLFSCSLFNQVEAQQVKRVSTALKHGANRIGKRTDADMQRWRDHGLGQFLHWGVYAIPGGRWQGKAYPGAAEWIRSWDGMPNEAYDNLYKQFNPTSFDATQWAKQAKDMGAKYMIITTKHHDGFCIWPSKYTDYTVKNTPYKKDILKEIVDAYDKEGIDVHLYFSIIDWSHSGYRNIIKSKEDSVAYEDFKKFTRNQLFELLTDYPTAKGLWFDGTWDKAWVNEAEFADNLDKEMRAFRPGLVIGSRFRADDNGKRHYDTNGDLIGDYDQTWERNLPDSMEDLNGVDWDCVMTIPQNQWGYNSDWKGYIKTSNDLIKMLVKSVSLNGNFVLNFGPDGKGAIRQEETKLTKEIGEWMKINSDAVYGCTYAGLKEQGWGYYTRKGKYIYMTVVNHPVDNMLRVEIKKGGSIPQSAYLLDGKRKINIIDAAKDKFNNNLYNIEIPKDYRSNKPFVIVLEVSDENSNSEEYQQAKT